MNESLLATALAWTRHGAKVFPIWPPRPGPDGKLACACGRACKPQSRAKHPLAAIKDGRIPIAPNGRLSATIESGTIKHWWSLVPDANIGVDTDALLVLDVDARNGGDETFAALEREHELPPTWRALTGGGGQHVIFRKPPGLIVDPVHPIGHDERGTPTYSRPPPLGPGVDLISRDGYIVSPPSRHISGRHYSWDVDAHPSETPLAEPPEWLLERLAEASPNGRSEQRTSSEKWASVATAIVDQYQDQAACRVAGHLLRRFVEPALVWALMDGWNHRFCRPPIPDDELRRVLDRVADLELARRDRLTAERAAKLAAHDACENDIREILGVRR